MVYNVLKNIHMLGREKDREIPLKNIVRWENWGEHGRMGWLLEEGSIWEQRRKYLN